MSELCRVLDVAWALLTPPRTAVLATASDRGAEARVVVLRGADRTAGLTWLYTDAESPKIAQIATHPGGTLVFWEPASGRQLRVAVDLSAGPGTTADWASMTPEARGNYGTLPPPGHPIPQATAYVRQPEPTRFAVVVGRITAFDLVELATEPHRRARFDAADDWAGRWLAP
jgi:hypothetical protein